MQRFLKFVFMFIALVATLWATPQEVYNYDIQPVNYIQNDYQKVVLVSNTLRTNDAISNPEDGNSGLFIGENHFSTVDFLQNHNFTNNSSRQYRDSIHKLSTDNERILSIRAP